IEPRCYGCGRCLPICPHGKITARTHQLTPAEAMDLLAATAATTGIDAIEIHTQPGRVAEFFRLWQAIAPAYSQSSKYPLRLLAVSCPDGVDLIDYQQTLYGLIRAQWSGPLVWQTDGRPMSGDIGAGTTRASVRLARKVLAAGPPGYIQLAGGTNQHTVSKLHLQGLLATPRRSSASRSVAGVAYGSYARAQLAPIFARLVEFEALTGMGEAQAGALVSLETVPELLWQAVATATTLVSQLKTSQTTCTALHDRP
ncbi:MAG: LdpA C-terminal domain-containing domain, partial [Cyanobacteria bacterium J06641_5]